MPLPVESLHIAEVRPLYVGIRRELFADRTLLYALRGSARLTLHRPVPRDLVLVHEAPWEGNTCAYHTIFHDPDLRRYRMTYRGSHADAATHTSAHPEVTCYAESVDGVRWTRPSLGLVAFEGSRDNNILWAGPGTHNFTPFRDANPDAPAEARYKAVGGTQQEGGLFAFQSPDGIHWRLMQDAPVITAGAFDSQNLAFWDVVRGEYRAYIRDFAKDGDAPGVRGIKTATSPDFLHWSDPVWLRYAPAGYPPLQREAPPMHLYTNAILPYPRAPHLFVGFPTRFVPDRESLTEGLFMISRDGVTFDRWDDAFLPPGPNAERWHNRSNYIWWGLVETASPIPGAPRELTLYSNEHYYKEGGVRIRRYTLRQDGFVSVRAGFDGGEVLTRPLFFEGRRLALNVATAAAGEVRVGLERASGQPYAGFSLDDCVPFYGDTLSHVVHWRRDGDPSPDVGPLAGQGVRVRIALRDADVYAMQFYV